MKQMAGEKQFYQLYFQEPGKAEPELEADVRKTMLMSLYSRSGDAPPEKRWRFLFDILLNSRDVIHSFYVPWFRLYQDAVPGRTISWVWFQVERPGNFELTGRNRRNRFRELEGPRYRKRVRSRLGRLTRSLACKANQKMEWSNSQSVARQQRTA
jgi:hypothetical protein